MRIAYIFDPHVGNFHYGAHHPMKPHRIAVTHSLVHTFELDKHMTIIKPKITDESSKLLLNYHTPGYIDSLYNLDNNRIKSKNKQVGTEQNTKAPYQNASLQDFMDISSSLFPSEDCPCFPGISEYCTRYSVASLTAAKLINENFDICINWSGGLHHAKKSEPSGFCYTNDIVLCIQSLLTKHKRVMYIDIDIHHGDGVEEAFYYTDDVLTLSLHKFGENYFPGTGDLITNTKSAINVPLKTGMDDASYKYVFESVVLHAINKFDPCAIVLQCGADSLAGDRIGCFNLSIYGHGECIRFVKKHAKKLVVLGGGGYNLKNVSRCWTYETSLICDVDIDSTIPSTNAYYEYFCDEETLHPNLNKKNENKNTKKYLDTVMGYVHDNIDKMK